MHPPFKKSGYGPELGKIRPIKATVIISNNIITKHLIIVTVSIGWEALTTNLNKHASQIIKYTLSLH